MFNLSFNEKEYYKKRKDFKTKFEKNVTIFLDSMHMILKLFETVPQTIG